MEMSPLERAFRNLEFGMDDIAYWRLPSGYQLVVIYQWPADYGVEYPTTYDVDIRGHGHIDLTQCPLHYMYDRGSFSNMSSTDVVKLAAWIEKYADDKERSLS